MTFIITVEIIRGDQLLIINPRKEVKVQQIWIKRIFRIESGKTRKMDKIKFPLHDILF